MSHAFDPPADAFVSPKSENDNEPIRGPLKTLWQAFRVREDEQLSAADSASTIFRFFRSDHVVDLNRFFKLALYIFLAVIVIGTLYAITKPAIHLVLHTTPGAVFYHGRRAFLLHVALVSITDVLPTIITFVAPAITICGGIMAWTYLSAATRLGVVDLFGCEIRTLCRVSTAFDIGRIYVARYDGKVADHQPAQSSGFKSEEDYFPVFGSNSHDLEALEATVVGYITEFYTYMKTFRDLQRKLLEDSNSTEERKWLTANSIYVLYLGFESARRAINELVEFEPTQAENILVVLLTELVCYPFLCRLFRDDELRLSRLLLRLDEYQTKVRALVAIVDDHKDDPDWAAAKRTLPELIERYNEMLKALKDIKLEEAASMQPLPGRRSRPQAAALVQPVAVAAS